MGSPFYPLPPPQIIITLKDNDAPVTAHGCIDSTPPWHINLGAAYPTGCPFPPLVPRPYSLLDLYELVTLASRELHLQPVLLTVLFRIVTVNVDLPYFWILWSPSYGASYPRFWPVYTLFLPFYYLVSQLQHPKSHSPLWSKSHALTSHLPIHYLHFTWLHSLLPSSLLGTTNLPSPTPFTMAP